METTKTIVNPIPQDVMSQATDLFLQGQALLVPYFVTLTPEDRKNMLKMNNGTDPFVAQGLQYMGSNPEFIPSFVNAKEVGTDYDNYDGLSPLYALLTQVCSQVSDTKMASGGSAYNGVLSFYNNVKLAAKNRVPGAKTIFEDLKKRFEKKKKTVEEKQLLAELQRNKEEEKRILKEIKQKREEEKKGVTKPNAKQDEAA